MSEKSALPSHSTEVNTTAAWDNGMNERRVKSPGTRDYFRRIYAWLDNGADDTRKSSYRFIHHMVAADGTPGDANFRALAAGIAALNGARQGTVLDDAGRRGVYRHLSAHYDDAGRQAPPLLAKSEIDEIFSSLERKSNDLFIGSQICLEEDGDVLFGTVVSVKDGLAEVREWVQEEGQWLPTDSIHDILVSSVKIGVFMSDPDDDDDDDDEVSTLPYCIDEKNLSNILTSELKDGEMTEQDFEVLVKSIAKLVIAEVGMKIDPPAGFSNKPAKSEEDVEEDADTAPVVEMPEEDANEAEEATAPVDEAVEADEADAPADSEEKSNPLIDTLKDIFEASEDDEHGIAKFIAERIDMHEKRILQAASLASASETPKAEDAVEEVKEAEEAEVKEACCAEDCEHSECDCCKNDEVVSSEDAPAEAEAVEGEKSDTLTLKDLQEFSELVKML